MAIIPLEPGNFDTFEIVGRPRQRFVSGNHVSPTGSMPLVSNKSNSIKDIDVREEFGSGPSVDSSYRAILESTRNGDCAQFTITIGSGSFSHFAPAGIIVKTKSDTNPLKLTPYKFFLRTTGSQTIPTSIESGYRDVFNTEVDVSDITALNPSDFTTQKGVRQIAKRIQNAINKPLLTPRREDTTIFENVEHFFAADPVQPNAEKEVYQITVQYLKTAHYDGGSSGFIVPNGVENGTNANITVSAKFVDTNTSIETKLDQLLAETSDQPVSANQGKQLRVIRFEPSTRFTKDTMRKNVVKDVLYPSMRPYYPNLNWAYSNYHSLNFFTGSGIPEDSAILYLNKLKPNFSFEIPVLKTEEFNESEFTKNSASGFVTPGEGFDVEGVVGGKAFANDAITFVVVGNNGLDNMRLTFNVPASAGGAGTDILIRTTTGVLTETAGQITVGTASLTAAQVRECLVGAINGQQVTISGQTKIRFGGLSGIVGLDASNGSTFGLITNIDLKATTGTGAGDLITVSEQSFNNFLNLSTGLVKVDTLKGRLQPNPSSDRVFVFNSTSGNGANFGRNIALTRRIPSGTLANIRLKAIRALGGASPAVGKIEIRSSATISDLNGIKITLIDNEGSPTTITYVLDSFNQYTAAAGEVKVNISAETTINGALGVLATSINSAGGHNSTIVAAAANSGITLTQGTAGISGNKTITVTGDNRLVVASTSFRGATESDLVTTPAGGALTAPAPSAPATGQIQVTGTGITNSSTLEISSTTQTVTYIFDTGTSNTGHKNESDQVVIGVQGSPDVSAIAEKIRVAILSGNGHNGQIKVERNTGTLSLTQRNKGASGNGNINIAGDTGGVLSRNNFTGGITGEDLVILHRLSSEGSFKEIHRVGVETLKAVNENEWTKIDFDVSGDNISEDYFIKIAQSDPNANNGDHIILHDINITLDTLAEGSTSALPYPYSPREDFTFSFWIKPKIVDRDKNGGYKAGTVLHLSSSYAISLVSGSSIDGFGRSDKFRMMFQFDTSANVAPSNVPLTYKNGEYPRDGRTITNSLVWKDDADLIYLSSDNSLNGNTWHHVAVRWSANRNNRSGSIFIDGNLDSTFHLNSGSAMPRSMPDSRGDPSVLFVGNYFDGRNDGNEGMLLSQFFNGNASYQEGLPCAYNTILKGTPARLSIRITSTDLVGVYLTLETSRGVKRTFEFNPFQSTGQKNGKGHFAVGAGNALPSIIAKRLETAIKRSLDEDSNFKVSRSRNVVNLIQPDSGPTGNTDVVLQFADSKGIGVASRFSGGVDAVPNYQIDNFLYRDPNEALYDVSHPLKAEVHEVAIYKEFRNHFDIKKDMKTQTSFPKENLVFYLPVHFTPESPTRDILQTPFQTFRSTTNDPFNVALSFGVGGKTMNLPNFTREHVQKVYPRLLNLTASAITTTDTRSRSADEWLGSVAAHRKGNYTVLPNDNGLFQPTYASIVTGSQSVKAISGSINYVYRDDSNYSRVGMINLRSMVSTASLPSNPGHLLQDLAAIPSGSLSKDSMTEQEVLDVLETRQKFIFNQLEGATPEDPGIAPGSILSILNRTRDPDSNEVVFFDVSNMFYGNRIAPETLNIVDTGLSGTYGSISLTLKDDGYGNVYRHDCLSKPATWNNVGDILYDEGIVTLKNPILSHFGRKQFDISFRGEQKVPVLEVSVPCGKNVFNSSSNPNFLPLKPSNDANEYAEDFVYITGVNLHDENFNIVGKATFAQPVIKRKSDAFLVKLKMDF